jgi:hypothetical protein
MMGTEAVPGQLPFAVLAMLCWEVQREVPCYDEMDEVKAGSCASLVPSGELHVYILLGRLENITA